MPDCDVAHEKAALNAYMATQFNTAYNAASRTYQDRAFSLLLFSNPLKNDLSKTQGMYRSTAYFPDTKKGYSSSTSNYTSIGTSGTSYTPSSASGSYSGCSGGGCYRG